MTAREIFEKWHPVPEGIEWLEHKKQYESDNDTPLSVADDYNFGYEIFQSGMAAGMERAAEEADNYESSFGSMGSSSAARALRSLAAAIRAMKEQKK